MIVPVLLLASALLVTPARPGRRRLHVVLGAPTAAGGAAGSRPEVTGRAGLLLPTACLAAASRLRRRLLPRRGRTEPADPLLLAAGWDLLAAGLRAGLPVPVAVRAVAAEFTGSAAESLAEVAELLALGSDPVSAWEPALRHPGTAELARAARRTARTGSGLAGVAADLAAEVRASAGARAEARAQQAAVWISAPLGLCFLPAFLCLGVLPVVVGMVGRLVAGW